MRYAVDIAPLGSFADPAVIIRLAQAAEAAGWDGLSIWDSTGVGMGTEAPDPFVALAGVAAATERLRLILSVVVLPRRRPQLVTQSVGTLDRISGGRVVLGVGAGGDPGDLDAFGDAAPSAVRAARMDADLLVIDRWLRGEPAAVDAPGASAVTVGPRPLQQPRPPIWVGGMRPGALRRAARWEGWIALAISDDGGRMVLAPEAFGGMVDRLREERQSIGATGDADVAVLGLTDPVDVARPAVVGAFADAGATWWLESLSPLRGSLDANLAVVQAGPPRAR
jgi:alkanesulfonate monooxygenase SsuD/methylene tetrahydromethanopterin reductase-like flavin-dependent oxidoreductase (luciferase family)